MLIFFLLLGFAVYFSCHSLYILVQALAGLFQGKNLYKTEDLDKLNSFCVLIPAYMEDEVIIQTANFAIRQEYPKNKFRICIIADSLKKDTLTKLKSLNVDLIEASFEKSTKSKAINFALNTLDVSYDNLVLLDADNLIGKDYLTKINSMVNEGYTAIQTRRVAKNLNTPVACLDAISEEINNHIYRKGATNLGLSSAVIGSGMVFNFKLFKDIMQNIDAVGGFDKVLQLMLVEHNVKIIYMHDALVFDEKVESVVNYKNQRKRWISAQFIYLKKYFGKGFLKLLHGNFDFFNFSVLHNVFLPKFAVVASLVVLTLISIPFSNSFNPFVFIGILCFFMLSHLIAIPRKLFPYFFTSLAYLPLLIFSTIMSIMKIKGANKSFINTKHHQNKIDEEVLEIYQS